MTVALFLFWDCSGRLKPWNLRDIHALDVQLLNTNTWSKSVSENMADLDIIMKKELRYYLDNDLRIYERLDPHYESMKTSISEVDSIAKELETILLSIKKDRPSGLDSIATDTSVTYRKLINKKSVGLQKGKLEYQNSLEELKKGFKKARKKLIYINDVTFPLKKTLYNIKYQRSAHQKYINHFNQALNYALFTEPGSLYSNNIINISKKIESYRVTMDKYESFLSMLDMVAKKEVGGSVILLKKKSEPFLFNDQYQKGLEQYLDILEDIKKISESI